ncbi:MAG TPA: sulfurtransferase-like selenium metabolism protein YedF [Chitinispirillaceae bacterium]|jgi:selenium metabolism protein YedF|nr:sulfurtransferase-like selenium metabolism protein YedF [Chitinispirillaceae bacterium]
MEEKLVDARGQVCPMPLIMTKKALKELGTGQPLRILIDNETSKQNVMRFLSDNGIKAECEEENGVFTLRLFGAPANLSHPDAESYCNTGESKPHVVVINSDKMGRGSDELGEILIKAFINTIKEVSPLPGAVVFYNSGIFLTLKDSPVLESLVELERAGVKILICGTCLNYYEKKEQIGVGTVSNMYTILETLSNAGHIVCP